MNISSLLEQWPVDHAAAAVVQHGQVIDTFGAQDRVFELASVTKLLAAYGVLIAVEEGAFDLDTALPVPDSEATATVEQLLCHAGGVGFQRGDRIKEAGSRRIYSSFGFEILGEEIARQAQMPFAQYLEEAVFGPLSMHKTQLWGSPGHEARSTVADLVKFIQEVLQPQLLAEETVQHAASVHMPDLNGIVPGYGMQKPCPWGLGFEIKGGKQPHWTGKSQPAHTIGHFGQSGTYVWVDRESQHGMVALTDRAFGEWAKPLWALNNEEIWKQLG